MGAPLTYGLPFDQSDHKAPAFWLWTKLGHQVPEGDRQPYGQYAADVTSIHAKIWVPFEHFPKCLNQAKDLMKTLHNHMECSQLQTSTIAALEFMQVPIQFTRVWFEDVLKKLPEQDAAQALTDDQGH